MKKYFLPLLFLSGCFTTQAFAQTEAETIDRLKQTYGYEKILKAKSITIESEMFVRYNDEGYAAHEKQPDLLFQKLILQPAAQKALNEVTANHQGDFVHYGDFAGPESTIFVSFKDGYHWDRGEGGYYTSVGAYLRGSDTVIAFELIRAEEKNYVGTQNYFGMPHDVLSFTFPGSSEMVVFVDQDTGVIKKVDRSFPNFDLTYVFQQHKETRGITYASKFTFMNNNMIGSHVSDRTLYVNRDKIELPMKPSPERIEPGEDVHVITIAENAFHIGQNGMYTGVFDQGDSYVIYGTHSNLTEKLAELPTKPISAMIVPHHNWAFEPDTEILTPEMLIYTTASARTWLEDLIPDHPKDNIIDISTQHQFGDVTLHNTNTMFVNEMLVAHHTPSGHVFDTNHYISTLMHENSKGSTHGRSFMQAMQALGVTPISYSNMFSPKIINWDDFVEIHEREIVKCNPSRKICRNWK